MTDSLSRQLERELAAYKAEVELAASKAEVEFWKAKAYEAEFHEGKHEAEVERLREQLQQAVDIAEWYMDNLVQSPRKDKLEAIKETLNLTKK